MPGRHDWHSWESYKAVHDSVIRDYEHFILDDQLEATATRELVSWDGVLHCCDGIEIHVRKLQDVELELTSGRPMVRTSYYSYQVLRRITDRQVINLVRYDNAHPHPDHPDAHHRHDYRPDGTIIEPPTHVGEDGWPTLGNVIQEIHERWAAWRELLARNPALGRDQPAL